VTAIVVAPAPAPDAALAGVAAEVRVRGDARDAGRQEGAFDGDRALAPSGG
jgi:hypothetical protein